MSLAFAGVKQTLWDGGFPCDHTKPVQWSGDLQPVREPVLCDGAEAEARGSLCLSGWAGLCVYRAVYLA